MTTYRRGTAADSEPCFRVFEAAISDLGQRTGTIASSPGNEPWPWEIRRSLFDHLALTADEWWIAENDSPAIVGYARSIERDGTRELTEFFVHPAAQAGGVGRELLARAFPVAGARHRSIIATIDNRAVSRYLRSGLAGRLPIAGFEATPRSVAIETDLVREPIVATDRTLEALAMIDRSLLGFRRDVDHRWLATDRTGWLYRRAGEPAAYGYHQGTEGWGGPYAALEAEDLPVILADAETAAFESGHAAVYFAVALVARTAIDHLFARGFRVDPFLMLFFTDGPIDGLDRYVLTSPPFFL
ncbi:MAG: GNAT family N-acetyltransferase [Chloroflexota bacterium]